MNAGRELDLLVAEKVMGWEIDKSRKLYRKPGEQFWSGFEFIPDGPFRGDDGQPGWAPSTDISAAWDVVERVRKAHWRDVISLFGPTDESNAWYCHFEKKWHGRDGSVVEIYDMECGDTAPHAICLAALRAFEVQVPKRSIGPLSGGSAF